MACPCGVAAAPFFARLVAVPILLFAGVSHAAFSPALQQEEQASFLGAVVQEARPAMERARISFFM